VVWGKKGISTSIGLWFFINHYWLYSFRLSLNNDLVLTKLLISLSHCWPQYFYFQNAYWIIANFDSKIIVSFSISNAFHITLIEHTFEKKIFSSHFWKVWGVFPDHHICCWPNYTGMFFSCFGTGFFPLKLIYVCIIIYSFLFLVETMYENIVNQNLFLSFSCFYLCY